MIEVYRNPVTPGKISVNIGDALAIKTLYESNINTNEFNDLEKERINNYPQSPQELHIDGGIWQ